MATIPSTLQRTSWGVPSIQQGAHRQIIDGVGATRTLAPEESGALCRFDVATGVVYTLPPPVVGMQFEFCVTVSVTSNAHKIITDAATTFIVGAVVMGSIATATVGGFSANGTTIRALSANGTTTGGLIGETYRVTCISATQWQINGVCIGSGTLATPFATS
jgi:hypothetical protein